MKRVAALPFVVLAASLTFAQPREVEVRTALSQTAVWVADRVVYTITVVCHKGVDILGDDLSKDKLHVEGLEIVGSESSRTSGTGDETIYTFRYLLTTYRVDVPELKIAPMTVRYYVKRPGQRVGDAAPAGEVQVPAASIAFRSALPDGQDTFALRDGRDPHPRRLRYAWLQPVGLALVLISVVPAAVAGIALVRRARPREKPRSARQVQHDEREALESLRALDVSAPAGRREAYSRMNALVRDHLHHATGVATAGLTAAEVRAALAAHNGRIPAALVGDVLDACDRARYAPVDSLPSADECRTAIDQAARLTAND
jgi:Domain of unknown function (DUF4381)